MLHTLKIIIIGPLGSGKSTIANLLADATELSNDYHPTIGVRILEFESEEIIVKERPIKIDIELWDCSGNLKFMKCWPAISKNVHGILFIYSGDTTRNIDSLQKFYEYFVEKTKLGPRNCIVFHIENNSENENKLHSAFAQVSQIKCNMETDSNKIKQSFQTYLEMLVNNLQENTDRQENNLFDNSF